MDDFNLSGHILISSNTVNDLCTTDNIILVFNSNSKMTTGLILNKPIQDIYLDTLLNQLNMGTKSDFKNVSHVKLYFGGPEDISKGFVIHTCDKKYSSTILIGNDLAVTYSLDILRDIANGIMPKQYFVAIGLVVWKGRELEGEIQNNTWITAKASHKLVFFDNAKAHKRYILNQIGVKQSNLSCFYGNA